MTEGAYSNHHPDVATPINPWNADRWTGVSSSGSGVATAAGLCFGSLGSDTGGSIRFPSACCGVVGLKPTWGRVPLSDVFPLANSLDHVGPMTRSVRDAAHMLGVLAGFDAGDPASRREPVPDYAAEIAAGIDGVRIGVDESFAYEQTDPGLESFVRAAVDVLGESGARVVPVRMPPFEELVASWVRVTAAEVALAHEPWFPAHADRYGPALRALLELGATVSAPEYARACELRRAFSGRLAALFEDVDLLALPSFSGPAPPQALFSAPIPVDAVSDLLRLTAPFDFSGSPTLSLPCGLSEDGLPFSLQLVGRHLEESLLFRAGLAFEAETNWHALHPPV
jgi:amidase